MDMGLVLFVPGDMPPALHISSTGTSTAFCLIKGNTEKEDELQMKESLLTTSIPFI